MAETARFCDKCGTQIVANEKFCHQCGSHNISYDYKGEPLKIEHHKDVPWLTRKRLAIFSIIGVALVLTASIAAVLNTPSRNDPVEGVISEPLTSVLPTRDDGIQTEWRMEPVENDYNQFVLSEFKPEGFTEAVQVYFHRNEFFTQDSSVRITAYKLESVERAAFEYTTLVTMIRETGGFTERQVSDINATCYSTSNLNSLYSPYDINSYCTSSNITFHVAGNSIYEDGVDEFARVVAQRVANLG